MHHELLLALAGHLGSVFYVSKETGLFEVIPDLPFVHPSEVSLINRLCRLGTYYLQLSSFIAEQNAGSLSLPTPGAPRDSTSQPARSGGLYHKALACGIDQVLDSYRQALVKIEEKCVSEPSLPLSHLQHELEQFQLLLPSLDACVKHTLEHGLYGCQILSHLHEQCSSGITIVRTAYERILAVCHNVLYKQLSAWMLHGLLIDDRREFFIDTAEPKTAVTASEAGQTRGETASSLEVTEARQISTSMFRINHSVTPSYVPLRIIEKILFVGEAVQIFLSGSQGPQGKFAITNMEAGSKLRADQFRFSQALTELQRQPLFQLRDFEATVDSIRDCVAEHLWRLLVEDSNLVRHLQTIKNFFLLGRGELFLAFVDLAHPFMKLPPSPTTQHDVNVAFQQAMTKIGMENEELIKQFQLTVESPKSGAKKPVLPLAGESGGPNAWRALGLRHTVSRPLHILFTPAILEKYNVLFKFLLALRRAQMALQQSWALLMQYRNRAEELRGVWQLRSHMGFIVDNLQYYVQVDVLEVQFSLLLEKIDLTHDFETIQHAHDTFIATLHSQLFLLLPSVALSLQEILELCNSLSSLLHRCQELRMSEEERGEMEKIAKAFKKQSSLFFKIVSSVKSHHSAPHLPQLLLRLDYNKYFSTHDPLAPSVSLSRPS